MYKALVTKVKIMPIEGSDNIQLAYCNGYSVIVGKDIQEGDLVVFFEAGGQLTKEFALPNNLYRKHPDTGTEMGGYFEPNLRVKAIKMRGARSDGFIAPLSSFKVLGVTDKDFAEGQLFDEINGVVICKKYFTPKTLARMGEKKQRKEVKLFPKHIDTGKFKQEYKSIPVGSLITISLKLHGCVHSDTIINTLEQGDLSIKDIVDNKLNVHIKALNTNLNTVEYVSIDAFYKEENSGEWYEIELENGEKITITGNNPVWLPDLQVYRRVDQLTTNEVLLVD